jgi:hypothetical protein
MAKKGWKKEPARHSLAAKGVKTRRISRNSFDGYPRLNLEKDVANGLVNLNYTRKDAIDDIGFTEMAFSPIADELEGEDCQRYKVMSEALFKNIWTLFNDPTALSEEDIQVWEKWLNIAYEKNKNGSDFDRVDAYTDAIEKYCIRLERVADHPETKRLAQECVWYAHDILKIWS